MNDKSKRKVKDLKDIQYEETAEEIFTLNINCPHCKNPLSISLTKLKLETKKT